MIYDPEQHNAIMLQFDCDASKLAQEIVRLRESLAIAQEAAAAWQRMYSEHPSKRQYPTQSQTGMSTYALMGHPCSGAVYDAYADVAELLSRANKRLSRIKDALETSDPHGIGVP